MAEMGGVAECFTIVSCASDEEIAVQARQALLAGGLGMTSAEDPRCGVAVMLVSESAVSDPDWWRIAEATTCPRLVPVRLDAVDAFRMPSRLREINWVQLDQSSPEKTWADVVAVARSKGLLREEVDQLGRQAEVWARAGHPAGMLIADRSLAARAETMLQAVAEDTLLQPTWLMHDFVRRSISYAQQKRRRAWARRFTAIGAVLVIVFLVALAIPTAREAVRLNNAAGPLSGDARAESIYPDWMAVMASSMLQTGQRDQQALAREVLRDSLSVPWDLGFIVVGPNAHIGAMKPLSRSNEEAVIIQMDQGSVFAIYDLRASRQLWSIPLDGRFWTIDVTSDERQAVVSGAGGIEVVDLTQRSVRRLPPTELDPLLARVTDDGDIVVGTRDGRVFRTEVGARTPAQEVAAFESVLDVRTTADGGIRVLATRGPGHYALVNGIDGAVIAEAVLDAPISDVGAVAVDRPAAVVVGGDNQLWLVEPGSPPRPTGVAVPDRTYTMVALSDDRYALDGQIEQAHVVHLGTGIDLGVVCPQVTPRIYVIEPSYDGDRLTCLGGSLNATWDAPAAPTQPLAESQLGSTTQSAGDVTIEAAGNRVRVVRGPTVLGNDSGWWPPFEGDVTAVSLADDATRAIVGSSLGEVAIVDTTTTALEQPLVHWRTPDGAPVTAAGWEPHATVTTAAGLTWRTPDCAQCVSDTELIAEVRRRSSGCWNDRQLEFIEPTTRAALDLSVCELWPGLG